MVINIWLCIGNWFTYNSDLWHSFELNPQHSPQSTHWLWTKWMIFYNDILSTVFLAENSSIFIWVSLKCVYGGLIDDKSTLVEVMAWCYLAPSHYLDQWWQRSTISHAITRPKSVELTMFFCLSFDCYAQIKGIIVVCRPPTIHTYNPWWCY